MRCVAIAGLLLVAAQIATAQADGLDNAMSGLSWGEAPEAVQRQLGPRGFAVPQPIDFGDSYAPLAVRDVTIGNYPLIAYYQVDKTPHRLKRIQLERPRHMVNAGAFHGVFLALAADLGAPDKECGTLPGPTTAYQGSAEYVWRHNGSVIRAIFRDTTLEAYSGCYSPACGLTAQLIVRISPPAEDSGVCPPLPTRQVHSRL
jgi:hypothetical protein